MANRAFLASAQGPFLRTAIEGVLRDAGVDYETQARSGVSVALGIHSTDGTFSWEEFYVSVERLLDSKDLLCANGIVCEVKGRLLERSLEEIVKPLLCQSAPSLDRLARFVEINNKETVRALFDATLRLSGGPELLSSVFFDLASRGSPALRSLVRALRFHDTGQEFSRRVTDQASEAMKSTRLVLLDLLAELPESTHRLEALVRGLRDPDGEIRDAASEALFTIYKQDFGYDAEGEECEREEAVLELLDRHAPHRE